MVKVSVLGAAGGIGQPLSLLLRQHPLIDELSLFDIVNAPGVAADLSHIPTRQIVKGYGPKDKTDEGAIKNALIGCDVVIIPAGIPRKPGMTRDDLFKINAGIIKSLVHQVGLVCPNAILCIISNPVNSTVPIAVEELKRLGVFNAKKVFGVTTLDNLRLEQFLSELIKINPVDLKGDVLAIGGHSGDSIVPILKNWKEKLNETDYKKLVYRVQFGGDEVVKAKDGKGSATLSMATAAFRFVDGVVRALNGETVKDVAFVKVDEFGLDIGVQYFSLPVVIGAGGIEKVEIQSAPVATYEEEMLKIAKSKVAVDVQRGFDFVHGSKL
ncbi:malate dehydrogenase [Martiniozyma asiatica (nom. inval.)]|nr:malate dehydrogenase [Martiniozyma asiatica]